MLMKRVPSPRSTCTKTVFTFWKEPSQKGRRRRDCSSNPCSSSTKRASGYATSRFTRTGFHRLRVLNINRDAFTGKEGNYANPVLAPWDNMCARFSVTRTSPSLPQQLRHVKMDNDGRQGY